MRILLLFSWRFLILVCFLLSTIIDLVFASGQCLPSQRSLLLELKGNLKFNQSNSAKLVTWKPEKDCCSWNGVQCDALGRVIRLELDGEGLTGGIENSTSLFSLQYLKILNLANNSFPATEIPNGIGNLLNLEYLNLSNANFVGQIPVELSNLKNLSYLALATLFQGSNPLKLENPNLKTLIRGLPNLQEVYLDGVDLSSQRSEWCQALASSRKLRVLSLIKCDISGPIDTSLSQLQSLSVIRLDQNNFSIEVPKFLAEFSNLTTLSIRSANLQGQFPEKIFKVPTLQFLILSGNMFLKGRLPEFPKGAAFKAIALDSTNFSGPLPVSIGFLANLTTIDLSKCSFSGSIPPTMANLSNLVYLDFSSNNFTGQFPSFNQSTKLEHIDLSYNALTGSISNTKFEGLPSLSNIDLGNNELSGKIPKSMFTLPSLKQLSLSNNQFSGQIDEFPNASTSWLDTIDLNSNNLNGSIPKSVFELRNLKVLSLSSNSFTGIIQLEAIIRLQNLTRLELSYNNLTVVHDSSKFNPSSMPQLRVLKLASCRLDTFLPLRTQSKMSYLDLSDNRLKGDVPKWIWGIANLTLSHVNLSWNFLTGLEKPHNFPNLVVIDLHSNQLQGDVPFPPTSALYVDYSNNSFNSTIPSNIGKNIKYTSFLSFANNSLTGSIPESMCNATNLLVLDLSDNELSGLLPSCLVSTSSTLGVMNLARNNLSGSIPDSFPVSCGLKTLDLSQNSLEGKVPESLVNCTRLEVLNIGNNGIKDTFPCSLKNSSSLRVLVFRSNKFHGEVTCSGAENSWSKLQIIDIASNNFSGVLHYTCFSNWTNMMVIDKNESSRGDHLSYGFLVLNNFYYQDKVTVSIKGLEIELEKILTVFTSIDFSGNKFSGDIPDSIGMLTALYALKFSHNGFSGRIPSSIGNLINLQSLDLSGNNITGDIPATLTDLTFLSFLNLSNNNLTGSIPKGPQLQTFTADSYLHNPFLCGYPLNACGSKFLPTSSVIWNSMNEFDWRFIFTGLGLGVGAAIIFAPLAFSRKRRDWHDKNLNRLFLFLFPSYRFTYVRYDEMKISELKTFKDSCSEDSEDFDEDEFQSQFRGSYCLFCTKLDVHRKKAIHNLRCNCHESPPKISYSQTSSSTCSLLVIHH